MPQSHDQAVDLGFNIRSFETPSRVNPAVSMDGNKSYDICAEGNGSMCHSIVSGYKNSDHWFDAKSETVLVVCYCVVMVLGIFGNSVICFVMMKFKQLRRPRNILILNLSICDIAMCILCMPFSLVRLTLKNWYLGEFLCKLSPTVQSLNVFVSTFTIIAIAVDRYSAIVCASRENTYKSIVYYFIALIWLLSILICVPMMVFHEVHDVNSNVMGVQLYHICMEVWPVDCLKKIYTTFVLIFQYVLPLVILSCLHLRICQFLKLRINDHPRTEREMNRAFREIKRHKKNMLLLTAIALSFAVAWMPLTIMNTLADYGYQMFMNRNFNQAYAYCLLVALCSSCLNPIVYGWFNSNFRQAFLQVLCCRKKELADNMEMATIKTSSNQKGGRPRFYSSLHGDSDRGTTKSSSSRRSQASSKTNSLKTASPISEKSDIVPGGGNT